ncbi:MAG: hypothetical protein V3T86_16050 [Planctomycetota bacterium]
MSPHLPVEDPSHGASLLDQLGVQIRSSLLLRVLLVVTLGNCGAAVLLALTGHLGARLAGTVLLLMGLSWFFAVGLPLMNREVRFHMSGTRGGYWTELVEMFFRVILAASTFLCTAMLIYAALGTDL